MAVLPTSTIIFCPNPQYDVLATDRKKLLLFSIEVTISQWTEIPMCCRQCDKEIFVVNRNM